MKTCLLHTSIFPFRGRWSLSPESRARARDNGHLFPFTLMKLFFFPALTHEQRDTKTSIRPQSVRSGRFSHLDPRPDGAVYTNSHTGKSHCCWPLVWFGGSDCPVYCVDPVVLTLCVHPSCSHLCHLSDTRRWIHDAALRPVAFADVIRCDQVGPGGTRWDQV